MPYGPCKPTDILMADPVQQLDLQIKTVKKNTFERVDNNMGFFNSCGHPTLFTKKLNIKDSLQWRIKP
jgi:hypothetical protein